MVHTVRVQVPFLAPRASTSVLAFYFIKNEGAVMKKIFPLSFLGKNLKSVILSTFFYTLIFVAVSIAVGCIKSEGNLAIVLNLFRQFTMLYTASGIVIAVLGACDLLDKGIFRNTDK